MEWNIQLAIIGKIGLAMLAGGLLGLEREIADKPAGLRTHMLVAGTSALLVSLSNSLIDTFRITSETNITPDPIRIVQAVILGIGFIGAGTIMRRKESQEVEGLTTGASLLLAAALGICVAVEQLFIAFGVTVLAVTVLMVFGLTEKWFASRRDG